MAFEKRNQGFFPRRLAIGILVFVIVSTLATCSEALVGFQQTQYVLTREHRLNKSLIYEKEVESLLDCGHLCLAELCRGCKSINFEKEETKNMNARKKCQLNNETKTTKPEILVPDPAFNYYEVINMKESDQTCEAKDVDKCSSKPCHQHATCRHTVSSYTCTCNRGFTGDGANCTDVDECNVNPCHKNATCNNTAGSYTCACIRGFIGNGTNCTVPKSCADLYKSGAKENAVYTIDPDDQGAFDVRCDMTTDGGGWTVFQRRMDGSVDFYLNWADYKNGFGNLGGELWLGLDKINRLSKSGQDVLRVDLGDFEGETRYAKYSTFAMADETDLYKLTVTGYSGNARDSLGDHSGMKFSTKDKDNDNDTRNCAVTYKGAWWYKSCHRSNLNGLYLRGRNTKFGEGVVWEYWKGDYYSLKTTEMKIRPRNF